jgi:wyosine [tRNA(Phe)-imidazoG37] synthetase (radical SAM superfamily)
VTEIAPRCFYPPERIAEAVAGRLKRLRDRGESVDYLTFVPDGEPTLDAGLGEAIDLLRPFDIPVAVISNASLLWREEVRANLGRADWVSVKVDAADEAIWRRINRPDPGLALDVVLDGIGGYGNLLQLSKPSGP